MKITMSADNMIDQSTKSGEAGITQAQQVRKSKANHETAGITGLENELKMSEARRGLVWKALNLLKKLPQVDYSKTRRYEVVGRGTRVSVRKVEWSRYEDGEIVASGQVDARAVEDDCTSGREDEGTVSNTV